MSDFKTRLVDEKGELDLKLSKLLLFINSDNFTKIDPIQQSLLIIQAKSMDTYSACLSQRLESL